MPSRRPRAVTGLAVALFLGALGCGRGCSCISGEKTYEHLDGKVKVELVRQTHWTGGRIPGPISNFVIRVHTTPAFDEPTACEKVELAEDDAGKNVAFRCADTTEWTVLRLRGGDRRIRECAPPVGSARKPAFGSLAKIPAIAPQLLECADGPFGRQRARYAEVVRSVGEEAGSAAATALVLDTVARPRGFELESQYDAWDGMLDVLSTEERAAVLTKVCADLLSEATPRVAYLHALRWCPLDDTQRLGEVALKRLQEALHGGDDARDGLELRWVAALASRGKAVEAAQVACSSGRDLKLPESGLLLTLVARGGIRCPSIAAALTPPPCSEDLDCDGGLCSAAALKTEIDTWVADAVTSTIADGGARRLDGDSYTPLRALLAAAYAQGPLPRELALPNARRHYELADAGAPCESALLAEGAPCTCHPYAHPECAVAAGEAHFEYEACSVTIDDAKRRFDARHLCRHAESDCGYGPPCCPGLDCMAQDGGAQKCKPARDGGAFAPEKPTTAP